MTPFLGEAAALAGWMEDPFVTDILINGRESLYLDRGEGLERLSSPFTSSEALFDFLERLLVPLHRRLDAAQPYLDGNLGEEGRFHVILPPAVPRDPHISIRKTRKSAAATWESFGDGDWIRERFLAGENFLICGATGSGKTTFLSRLLEGIPHQERVLVLEESREIVLSHPHVVSLEGRPPGPDGVGEISLKTLVRQALRMRPDRLILGECRGPEAFDLVGALTTGHRGSATTLHAGSCREALRRLESLVLSAGTGVPLGVVREWVSHAVQGVVVLEREGAARRIREVISVHGLEGDVYRITPRFPD